jgi:hypothetical protein
MSGPPLSTAELPPDVSRSNVVIVPSAIFYALTLVVYGLRMNDRKRRNNLGLDDIFITASVVRNNHFRLPVHHY